jgi:DNA polymerase-3 subunit gamma/tau
MDAASNRKIDDIRELIEQTKYQPSIARYKIFIIDEVHMLTKEAFNALLKTLEEPPSYVKFILATTDPLKLPPTILSRTQHFGFKKISTTDIFHHLQYVLGNEKIEYEKEAIEIIARSGNGSLRDTLTLLDQAIIYSKGKIETSAVVQMLGILDPKKIEDIFEAIFSKDKQKLQQLALFIESYDSEILLDDIVSFLKKKFFDQDRKYELFL